jgi:hypothetical protein
MTRIRSIVLALILLSGGISVFWGVSIANNGNEWADFRIVYNATRCLLEGHNPYKASELEDVYRREGGEHLWEPIEIRRGELACLHMPTTFLIAAPFAMLPWGSAHLLWLILTAGVFLLATFSMWGIGARYAPGISLALTCILLIDSEAIFVSGNVAGIAVGLCVLAVWCFLRERFVFAGIVCLAISLALKPHDAGVIWLYFLLAGGVYRKRALQTLLVTIVLALPAILWVSYAVPQWTHDLHSNLQEAAGPSGLCNPTPTAVNFDSPDKIIDLQSVISVFGDDPHFYNPFSYLICGALLLVWVTTTLRSRFSQPNAWLALAALAALSMLPVYHRQHDAKLLLLTVPACALLWSEGGAIGWFALVLNGAGILLTGGISSEALILFRESLHINSDGLPGKLLTVVLSRPLPLILLMMAVFYLWVYLRRTAAERESSMAENTST